MNQKQKLKQKEPIVIKNISYEDIMNSENILEAMMERILNERGIIKCPFCNIEIRDYKRHMEKMHYRNNDIMHILNKYDIKCYNDIIKKYVDKDIFFNLCNVKPITAHNGKRMNSSKYLNYLISNLFRYVKEK